MKSDNKKTGKLGEDLADKYLQKLGYEIITRNYQTRFGEIDLICKDGDILVFVEVKTKKRVIFGTPEEMFTRGKYQKVKRMAQLYLHGKEVKCRIDMVAVELLQNPPCVRHYRNVVF